jgi:YD repeat-containing protein
LGEFDGDGLPDLMIDEKISNLTPLSNLISIIVPIWNSNISDVSLASNYSNLSILYGKNPQVEFLSNLNNTSFTNLKFPIQTGDFNNDGKQEFIVFHNSFDAKIYNWNNNSTPLLFNSNISTNSITSFKLCDFNNDGNIDIFYRESSGYWKVKYCNGQSGFNNETIVLNENGTYDIDAGIVNELGVNISNQSTINSNFTIGDFNGDNLFDIYLASKNLQSKIFYSNGNDFKSESINYPYSVTYSKFTKSIQSIDVNGDGTFDVIGKDHDGFLTFPYNKETLNSVENAHIKYSFKETMLYKSSNFNESTYNPPLQSIKLVPKIMVVEELIETRHDKFYKKNKYYYQDYIYNRHGFGGLGFAKVAIYNTTDRQTLIEKRIPITPLFSNLIPISLETKTNCDFTNGINETGQLISDEKNSYKVIKPIPNNDNIIFQALTFKTKNDYINGNQIELCYEYDNFGNIKIIKEKHALISNLNNPEYLSIQQNTFFKINSWIPSSLIKTELYQKRRNLNGNFETPFSRVEHFEYDAFGRLTLVKNNTGNPNKYLATRTVYDQFGNTIQTSSENSYSTNLRKTEFIYQNGRFISSTKEMNNVITSYIVNPETGNKLQENLSFNKSNFWFTL